MKLIQRLFIFSFFWIFSSSLFSQVIPPGIGKTNLAYWIAGSIQQEIDSKRKWTSNTYIGVATESHPDQYNPFRKMGIIIVNQAFQHQFYKHWRISVEALYANNYKYFEQSPYSLSAIQQEFRLYGRLSYTWNIGKVMEITPTYRQEMQKYFTTDFQHPNETFRIRSRFRIKLGFHLTRDKQHQLLLFSEQLFSTSYLLNSQSWTPFQYKDSRFSLYYSFSPKNTAVTLNLGYMNNLIGTQNRWSTHFIAMDLVWKNPFGKR